VTAAAAAPRTEERSRPPSPPGPEPLPIIGGLPHLLRFGRDPIATAGHLFEKCFGAYALPGAYFHVNDDEHRRHRRLLQPAFHKTRIRSADGQWASAHRSLPAVRGKIRELMELPA